MNKESNCGEGGPHMSLKRMGKSFDSTRLHQIILTVNSFRCTAKNDYKQRKKLLWPRYFLKFHQKFSMYHCSERVNARYGNNKSANLPNICGPLSSTLIAFEWVTELSFCQ